MSDRLLQTVDALVAALQAQTAAPCLTAATIADVVYPATISWQTDPNVDRQAYDFTNLSLWVVDYGRDKDHTSGTPHDLLPVSVIVVQAVLSPELAAAQVRALSALCGQIEDWLVPSYGDADTLAGQRLALDAEQEAVCVRTARHEARDFARFHEDGIFMAEIITHWKRA